MNSNKALHRTLVRLRLIYTVANNVAVCPFATGQLDEATRVQTESMKAAPFPNPFGLSNLVTLHTVNGDMEARVVALARVRASAMLQNLML